MTLIGQVVAFIACLICYQWLWWGKIKLFLSKLISSFMFNNYLRFFTEGYLELFFGAVLNVFCLRHGSTSEIASFLTSIVFAFFLFWFPFVVAASLYDKRKELHTNEKYAKRFGTMYLTLKLDGHWALHQFYPLFLLRRLIFVIMVIVLEGWPEIQCNIFITTSFMVRFVNIIFCRWLDFWLFQNRSKKK